MSQDDDLPPKREKRHDEDSFSGSLGLTFTGLVWVAAFAVVGLVVLYALVRGF